MYRLKKKGRKKSTLHSSCCCYHALVIRAECKNGWGASRCGSAIWGRRPRHECKVVINGKIRHVSPNLVRRLGPNSLNKRPIFGCVGIRVLLGSEMLDFEKKMCMRCHRVFGTESTPRSKQVMKLQHRVGREFLQWLGLI